MKLTGKSSKVWATIGLLFALRNTFHLDSLYGKKNLDKTWKKLEEKLYEPSLLKEATTVPFNKVSFKKWFMPYSEYIKFQKMRKVWRVPVESKSCS